jgi:hypothetical protein
MKTKSCLDCFNLKVKAGTVWCVKGQIRPKSETLPLKHSDRYKKAKVCKDYEGMDE